MKIKKETNVQIPRGNRINKEGSIYVAEQSSKNILIFDKELNLKKKIFNENFLGLMDLEIDEINEKIFVTDTYNGIIKVINSSGKLIYEIKKEKRKI